MAKIVGALVGRKRFYEFTDKRRPRSLPVRWRAAGRHSRRTHLRRASGRSEACRAPALCREPITMPNPALWPGQAAIDRFRRRRCVQQRRCFEPVARFEAMNECEVVAHCAALSNGGRTCAMGYLTFAQSVRQIYRALRVRICTTFPAKRELRAATLYGTG